MNRLNGLILTVVQNWMTSKFTLLPQNTCAPLERRYPHPETAEPAKSISRSVFHHANWIKLPS